MAGPNSDLGVAKLPQQGSFTRFTSPGMVSWSPHLMWAAWDDHCRVTEPPVSHLVKLRLTKGQGKERVLASFFLGIQGC